AYLAAKWRVFDGMREGGMAILPSYIAELGTRQGLALPRGARTPGFTLKETKLKADDGEAVDLAKLPLKEPHNLVNAAFALLGARHLTGLSFAKGTAMLEDFRGLPHRCELVAHVNGRAVINDSKSTNVESTLVALQSQPAPVLLMMGGQG